MVKIESHRHKIKAFYLLVVLLNQIKLKGNRHNTGKSADNHKNRTLIEQNVKSQRNWCINPQKGRMVVPVFVQDA